MSCDHIDLKAYQFGEATASQRAAVDLHVRECPACRDELARLGALRAALASIPEEPMPQRIAFVSDKIFEPSWWQRLLSPSPVWAAVSAMMVVSAIGLNLTYQPAALPAPRVTARISPPEIEARIQAEVARQVDLVVKEAVNRAVTESEARQRKLMNARVEQLEMDQQVNLAQVREEYNVLQRKLGTMQILSARADMGETR